MPETAERGYRPISDYALIGDAHSAALVARDGSVDWCCWPHFDSPAVFCRILDAQRGGWFRVGPAAARYGVARSYVETTNVLATEFETDGGRFRLTDLMPIYRLTRTHEGEDIAARIREQLTAQGLVYRYLADDGLPGMEATFTLCGFWLVDNLALAGQADEARALFEKITGYANDVGLLSEEIEPESGELLGNHPQGFTHLGLICAALNIAKAESLGAEEKVETGVERAGEIELAASQAGARTRRTEG